jgi:magnesium-transporting ATPase (P-type)
MGSDSIFSGILFQWLLVLGVSLAAIALLVGIMLLLAPAQILRVADYLNREHSFSWLANWLERPRYIEPFLYRHHYVTGLLLVVFSGYFLWEAGTVFMPPIINPIFYGILMVLNLIAFLLGLVIFVRPSMLKQVEYALNYWVHTETAADRIEERIIGKPEKLARHYPRAFGAAILAAVLYIALVVLTRYWRP